MTLATRPGAIRQHAFRGADVAGDIRQKYGFDGDLLRIFAANKGEVVHKWHHYIPIYDRYFARYRGTPVRFLEIGVSKGGSLRMWREYFGPDAVLFGIDIDPDCARFDGQAGQVRIGSQDDPAFLAGVVAEMGGVDVVLDDGSHVMAHVRASLAALFPVLATGGLYMIEDLHTAYWKNWGGGYGMPANVFGDLAKIIDDMHRPYHGHADRMPGVGPFVSGVHVHDSIIVLEKDAVFAPVHSRVG
ncbi:MAG: class I SAM-dependent methyltransferase [Proteobacteria bacterium]|nr:class I SAM-dependent methyltransferase [Pseudomonadota bacterium]